MMVTLRPPRRSGALLGLLLGLLWALVGCDSGSGYQRRAGRWFHGEAVVAAEDPASFRGLDSLYARDARRGYYRGVAVSDSDGARFAVVSEHEAKDGTSVWYCDTHRDAAEYWSVQHLRIATIAGADAASYVALGRSHARDHRRVYANGVPFEVRDVASFEPMEGRFGRDAVRGYHAQREIAGSDGPSFRTIDPNDASYVRDRAHVWWGGADEADPATGRLRPTLRRLDLADPAALRIAGRGYAVDATRVWYHGVRLPNADAGTFQVDDTFLGDADASDRHGRWSHGVRSVVTVAGTAADIAPAAPSELSR